MRHLFASCAVIALMAAPALAQSTYEPTEPLVDSEQTLDPAMRDEADMTETFEPEADVVTESEADDAAEAGTVTETDPAADDAVESEEPETVAATDPMSGETEVADTDPMFGTESVAAAETFDAPIAVADLPEDYSTADLNAMMLAQLNVVAVEIADAQEASGSNVYASADSMAVSTENQAQTYAGADAVDPAEENDTSGSAGDMAMSDTATAGEMMSSDDATTQSPADGSAVNTDDYASTDRVDPALSPEGTGSSYGTATADTQPADDATTQGYAAAQSITEPTDETTENYAGVDRDSSVPETTDPSFGTAMTETSPVDETATQDYAETPPVTDETGVTTKDYAAAEPVDPALDSDAVDRADETAMMAAETDDSVQMAEQNDAAMVTAEGDIDQTAVEIAARDDRFTTLVELVGLSGLGDALSSEGPYTVFAPTNDAFAALPEETLTRLKSEDGKAELVDILQSHVVEGMLMAGEVPMAGQAVETIGDASLNVTGSIDGSLNVEGSKTVGDGVYASNGVVYAIDAVILPEAASQPAFTPEN
jgi:uncharacterized surface protein with fasciclin (FAS1) repeats